MKIKIDVTYGWRVLTTESFGISIKFVHKLYNLFLQIAMHCLMIIYTYSTPVTIRCNVFEMSQYHFYELKVYTRERFLSNENVCLSRCLFTIIFLKIIFNWRMKDCTTPYKKLFYYSYDRYVQTLRMVQNFERQHLEYAKKFEYTQKNPNVQTEDC